MWVVCVCATSDFVLGSLSWPSHPSGQQRWPICPASSASSKGGEFPFLGLPVTWTHPQKLPGPEHALHGKSEAIHGPWCQHGSNARKSHQMLNTREKESWAWINTTRIVNTSRIVKYCPSRLLFAGCPLTDLHIRLPSVLVKGLQWLHAAVILTSSGESWSPGSEIRDSPLTADPVIQASGVEARPSQDHPVAKKADAGDAGAIWTRHNPKPIAM